MKEGWNLKELKDICQIFNGGTPKTDIKEYWDGDIFWITPKDLGKLNDILIKNTERKITSLGLKKSSAKLLPVDSIILSCRAPIGHLAITTVPISTNQGCKGLVIDEKKNDVKYVYYFLKKSVDLLNELGTGTTFKEISGSTLSKVEIPIPSLSEQQAIVEKLDFAFDAIEKAKANIEKNIENAKELFQSKLFSIFQKSEDIYKYVDKKFEDICVLQRGFDLPTRLREEGNFPLVTSNGITDFVNNFKVKAPGVTTGRSGTIGKVHFIEKDFWPLNTSLYIKDFKRNNERFIYYFLQSVDILKYASGSGVPTLNRNFIHSEMFKMVEDTLLQLKIVKVLDQLSEQTNILQGKYKQKLANLEELKKSILEKAFKGKLV